VVEVRNNFMKTFITNDLQSVLCNGQPSAPYNKQGKHLDWIGLRIFSSEADLPVLPKNVCCMLLCFSFHWQLYLIRILRDILSTFDLSFTVFVFFACYSSLPHSILTVRRCLPA